MGCASGGVNVHPVPMLSPFSSATTTGPHQLEKHNARKLTVRPFNRQMDPLQRGASGLNIVQKGIHGNDGSAKPELCMQHGKALQPHIDTADLWSEPALIHTQHTSHVTCHLLKS